jgi:hypothetical protein
MRDRYDVDVVAGDLVQRYATIAGQPPDRSAAVVLTAAADAVPIVLRDALPEPLRAAARKLRRSISRRGTRPEAAKGAS